MRRRIFLASLAALGLAGTASAEEATGEPVLIGVSGPLTGQYAQYGAQWKRGFDLALDRANAQGGVKGRKLAYAFEQATHYRRPPQSTPAL